MALDKIRVLPSGEKNITVLHHPSGRIEWRLQMMKRGQAIDLRYTAAQGGLEKAKERRDEFHRTGKLPNTTLPAVPERPKVTLGQAILGYQRTMLDAWGQPLPTAGRCQTVVTNWRKYGLGWYLDMPIRDVTPALVLKARGARLTVGVKKDGTPGATPGTVNRDETVIRSTLLHYHGKSFAYPPTPRELPTRCPLLKPETLGQVLDRALGEPAASIVWLAAKTAMRLRSICSLRRDQVEWLPDGRARLVAVKTKTGLHHFPLSAACAELLRTQIRERATQSAYVFPTARGPRDRPISGVTVSRQWRLARQEIAALLRAEDPNEAAQLDGFRFHDLRHYAITEWLRARRSLAQIMMAAKLKDAELVTQRYGHLVPTEVTEMQDEVRIGAQHAAASARRLVGLRGGRP
jgi:integrase